jgi:predicted transcriptional regulator with HTH domain
MKEKSEIEKFIDTLSIGVEKAGQEEQKKKEKLKQEQEKIEEFHLNLRNSNIKTYNDYLKIYEDLAQNEIKKEKDALLKKYIDQLDKLIEVKGSNLHQEDHELANNLFLLRNSFIELQISVERNLTFSESIESNEEVLEDKETFKSYNKPKLDRKEIVFLMLAMRTHRVFMKDVSRTNLAKAFGMLTGLSPEKLRQFSLKNVEFTNEDKTTIKTILEKISKEVDELPSKNK